MDIHIEKKINFRRRRPKQIADDAGATKKTKNKKRNSCRQMPQWFSLRLDDCSKAVD